MAGLARGGACGPTPTQSPSRALSIRADDVLAGERAGHNGRSTICSSSGLLCKGSGSPGTLML
jgi:hypothetical protein